LKALRGTGWGGGGGGEFTIVETGQTSIIRLGSRLYKLWGLGGKKNRVETCPLKGGRG